MPRLGPYIIHEYIHTYHTYINTRNVALPHPTTPTQPTYIHIYIHTYIVVLKTKHFLWFFEHHQARTQDGSGLGGCRSHFALEYIHTYIHTYICCKGAVSDPLGTRIGIEFEGAVRRCCSSWKSSQQISSEPSTANPLHTYTPPKTQKKSQSINGRGTKSQTHAFPCVAHMLVVFLVCFSVLSESETARLIASNDAVKVNHGQCCRSLMNSNKSKTVEWTLWTTRQVLT